MSPDPSSTPVSGGTPPSGRDASASSPDPVGRRRFPAWPAAVGPAFGVVAAAWWLRTSSPWALVLVAAAALVGTSGRLRAPRPLLHAIGVGVLLALVPVGFVAHQRLADVRHDWAGYWAEREDRVFERLRAELDAVIERGDRTAQSLAELAAAAGGRPSWDAVRTLRSGSGFPAVAVYDPDGDLVVWDGTHRGRVPEHVQRGGAPYAYGELPLFSYMYFTYPVRDGGGTAVVASLFRTDLPRSLRARTGDLVSRVDRLTGETIRITRRERVEGALFDFVWPSEMGPDTLFSVTVDEPAPRDRVEVLRLRWSRVSAALLVLAWILLATAWRGEPEGRSWSAVGLLGLAAVAPFGELLGAGTLFRPAAFLLPGPFEVTLGRLLAVGLAVGLSAGLVRVRVPALPAWVAAVPVAVGFPLVIHLMAEGASASALGLRETDWALFQLTMTVLLALVTMLGLRTARKPDRASSVRAGPLVLSLVVAVALAAFAAVWVRLAAGIPLWLAAVWGVPALLAARSVAARRGWKRALFMWVAASVLATTAALPFAWAGRIQARMTMAESRMERLGADVDPYLDFLLGRLARTLDSLDARGAGSAELLYRGWLDSGLAQEGYPVWLTLYSPGGLVMEELAIGVAEDNPPAIGLSIVEEVIATGGTVIRRLVRPDAHYLLGVPLPEGRVVTGVVPPVEELGAPSPLGPLVGAVPGNGTDPLTMVPLPEDEGVPLETRLQQPSLVLDSLRWIRTAEGFSGEIALSYPAKRYHAHYLVDTPGPLVVAARATLLFVLNLAVLLAVFAVGRLVLLDVRPVGPEWKVLLGSFRARVTLALFGFFLLSNAIFGTLAFRTISGAAERAAEVLAARVAEDAAAVYSTAQTSMEILASRVNSDLLEYRGGELREGSSEALVELGLYEGWVPYPAYRSLTGGESLTATDEQALGRWEYVRAFRLLLDGDILAAPVPLQAGATAVRQREVADLLGFTVVAGGFLSLLLALLVGRTLTRPIHTLQIASERVGSGNLGVRLPADRADEFGAVFNAFNRMVRRLRRARRDLVRTTRRTQAIVEDAATGVVAFDPGGRIALVNPRALELIGRDVNVGEGLPEAGDDADELARWMRLYFRDGLGEATTEFQFGERRVRVRARRISREGAPGGAVLSLEDVTDELRTERILAWGEMARQVAHEVKNPLTPIKLSIQHIRRAFDDRRADFEAILDRNAEAALREIDRLAAIASSFSRFGAPEEAGRVPLQPVHLEPVVEEVLALYVSGEGSVRFGAAVEPGLGAVRARPSELKEVLVNLMENSRAAIQDEGRVTVEAERAGEGVVLRVRDDGSGIAPELLPRIFEPHFSTRSAGTGLGLAIVQRLVESWDGAVTVESEPGNGTVASVWLRPWDAGAGPAPDPDGGGADSTLPSDSSPAEGPNGDEPLHPERS